ncbi:PucR family transcriptional regulator [Longispora urticae]
MTLQEEVDGLAARVGRPAVIEDCDHRVVVYSEHDEPVDEVRRLSILRRHTTPEVVAWLRGQGITRATSPVRVPGCPELRMQPRVCVPVRHQGTLLGYVWFVDADRPLSPAQVTAAADGAGELAAPMFREVHATDEAYRRRSDAVRALLRDDGPARAGALRELAEDGYALDPVVALVVQPARTPPRGALETVLAAAAGARGYRNGLHLAHPDHGVLLTAERPGHPSVADCAARLHAATAKATDGAVLVGVGSPQAHAADSYRQALLGVRVGGVQPDLGPVVTWDRLGVYRLLAAVQGAGHVIHPGLDTLLADPAGRAFLGTLETYLDLAGNADATARRLHLHRTSLYYRLQRLEQLLDTNLKDGGERLCLHLALKLARLEGRFGQ